MSTGASIYAPPPLVTNVLVFLHQTKKRDGREQGGVVLLVSKLSESRPAAKFSSCGSQASLVWVTGCLFGSCHAAHDVQRLDFLKELLVCVGTQSSLTRFHLVGDWNDEPHEAPLVVALEGARARVVATGNAA